MSLRLPLAAAPALWPLQGTTAIKSELYPSSTPGAEQPLPHCPWEGTWAGEGDPGQRRRAWAGVTPKGPRKTGTMGRDSPCRDFRDVLAVSCSPQIQTCFPPLLGQADPSSPACPMEFAARGVCDTSSQHRDTLGRNLDGHIPLLPYPKGHSTLQLPHLSPCSLLLSDQSEW